ncbi:MAG: DUF2786 domain-containing protein [Candidatus Eremiobacterota bacterium]
MGESSTFQQLGSDERERVLDKLARLKALSECPTGNVNETAAAAAAMTRLMLEYQIEMAELEAAHCIKHEDEAVVDEPVSGRESYSGFPVWQTVILSALAQANHCISYTSSEPERVLWMCRTRSRLGLIGTARDIENTRRLFFFCVAEVERLARHWGPRETVKRRNDFKRGAANGIAHMVVRERDKVLREELERATARSESSAALELFHRKDRAVRAFAANQGIRYRSTRAPQVYRDAYQAGYHAGTNLDLGRGARPGLPAASSG